MHLSVDVVSVLPLLAAVFFCDSCVDICNLLHIYFTDSYV